MFSIVLCLMGWEEEGKERERKRETGRREREEVREESGFNDHKNQSKEPAVELIFIIIQWLVLPSSSSSSAGKKRKACKISAM